MLSIIIGIGIVAFLLFYFGNNLNEENWALKILMYSFAFIILIILAKAVIDTNTTCELVHNYTKTNLQYGNNFTYDNGTATYHWDYDASGIPPTTDKGVFLFHEYTYKTYDTICYNNTGSNTSSIFFRLILSIFGIYFAYVIYFMFYKLIMRFWEWIRTKIR